MKLTIVLRALGVGVALGTAATASAVNLSLTQNSSGFLFATASPKGGLLLDSHNSGPVQDQPLKRFTATIYSEVYANDPSNPLGGLTFWYQLENVVDAGTQGRDLYGMSIPLALSTAAIEVNSLGGPNKADLALFNASLAFVWLGVSTIEVGSASTWMVLYTDQPRYALQNVGVLDGTVEDVPALVPIPEPATHAALFALGLAAFAGYRRLRAR
jgi:hypothetical protein